LLLVEVSLLFFKPNILEVSLRISGVELWEGRGFAQLSWFEHSAFISLGGLAFRKPNAGETGTRIRGKGLMKGSILTADAMQTTVRD